MSACLSVSFKLSICLFIGGILPVHQFHSIDCPQNRSLYPPYDPNFLEQDSCCAILLVLCDL